MIKKRSNQFRGKNWCHIARDFDVLSLSSAGNVNYDNAIIIKEIIKGVLSKEYLFDEIPDLVDQGIEEEYLTEKAGEARKKALVKRIQRYCKDEKRAPVFPQEKELQIGDYLVTVKPDVIFVDINSFEAVIYRAGKPDIKQKEANECLELWFLLRYLRTLVPENETYHLKASYYFMRKTTDSSKEMDDYYFGDQGGNVVSVEEIYAGRSNDRAYEKILEEYSIGRECTEEECSKCQWNTVCNYTKEAEPVEKKTGASKNGTIIPSDAQQKIIDFRKGVCRVNASAGSGKTECVTERTARMIEEGVDPEKILLLTFTNAAALEMQERIAKKCAYRNLPITKKVTATTFNSFAYQIVKENFEDVGFTSSPLVVDDVRNSAIITQLLDENPIPGLDYLNYLLDMPNCRGALACVRNSFETIKQLQIDPDADDAENRLSDGLESLARFIPSSSISEILSLYKKYEERLKEENLLQFADQEPFMKRILDMHPGFLERYSFQHIIVDEFQDSNEAQIDTIKRLIACSSFESLMVVGDDSQSIYGFRYTSPENILHFFEKIGMEGEDLLLVENRRSSPEILELANKINDLNESKICKNMIPTRESGRKPIVRGFFSKDEEYNYIAQNIQNLIQKGYQPEDIAFIAFKRSELIEMGAKLSALGIPWIMKNPLPLMDNSRVKAAVSLAEAFYQPESEKLYFDYLNALYDGEIFNLRTIDEIKAEVDQMKREFMNFDLLTIPFQRKKFHDYLEKIGENDEIYRYFLELLYQNEDLQSELEYIKNFQSFGGKLAKKMEQDYEGVVLTTAHSSKGLEWKAVFNSITGYDSKILHGGGKKTLERREETRRLLFVSMTRARDLLWVTGQYVAYGPKSDRTYNQFLVELYNAMDQEFNPVDPLEAVKAEGRKKKAKNRGMSLEQQKAYQKAIQGAYQISMFD